MTTTTTAKRPYQLLPPLKPEEYAALRADIAKHGVLVAVEVDEDGNILDGHHRADIADGLGITYPTVTRSLGTEREKREHAIRMNINRRHLDPHEWGAAFKLLLAERGVGRGRGKNQKDHSATIADCAKELGVSDRTARHRIRRSDEYEQLPQASRSLVDEGKKPLSHMVKEQERDKKAAKRKRMAIKAAKEIQPGDDYGVLTGDMRQLSKAVADNSVDMIFTDPPYTREYLHLYSDLGEVAARVLKPGGSLICYAGAYALPQIIAALGEHMRWWWSLGERHTGQLAQMREYGVKVKWKPLLWFVKQTRGDAREFVLDLVDGIYDKAHHEWQQGQAAAEYYIKRLTEPGDLVLDPFAGSGTTAVVCNRLHRRWLLFEIDADTAMLARKRIREAGDANVKGDAA